MKARRFDEFVSALGRSSPRRRVLTALGGAALGSLAANSGAAKPAKRRATTTDLAPRGTSAPAKSACRERCGAFCDRRTAEIFCNPNDRRCACFRSVTGKIHCVSGDRQCPAAGSPNECRHDADCGPDAICGTTAGGLCCRGGAQAQVNICLKLCAPGGMPERSGEATASD